ncbi:MAG: prepilin-type N-terminal cleavage/methylation domain-containing protein [Caldisericia bacterium]|nr:prepilin-type N-terminal cleavage/methylation domain-containing protein [Caldisericia bacterium]
MNTIEKSRGQSLVEILVAVAIGVVLIGSSSFLIGVSLKSYNSTRQHLQANTLIREEVEAIQALARNNWHSIYSLNKETDYQISLSESTWVISTGQETGVVNDVPYKRYFQVYNVSRDVSGNISESGDNEPNSQKITIFLDYNNNYINSSSVSFYLVRSTNNQIFHQTDWSEGSGQAGPISNPGNLFASADSNINYASTTGSIYMTTPESTPAELISSILDTGIVGGAGFNSLLWQGALNTGGSVKFQIAFSNSISGPWNYYGPTSTEDWYQPNPNISTSFPISGSAVPQNNRYIRYKVQLSTSNTSPKIDDIIINWSP